MLNNKTKVSYTVKVYQNRKIVIFLSQKPVFKLILVILNRTDRQAERDAPLAPSVPLPFPVCRWRTGPPEQYKIGKKLKN